jgi:hypothetical protein
VSRLSGRALALVAICIVALLVAGGFVTWAVGHRDAVSTAAGGSGDVPVRGDVVYVETSAVGEPGPVAWASTSGGASPHRSDLRCHRVYAAGGRGVCLVANKAGTGFVARIVDGAFRGTADVPLAGSPSRARVSADGKYGAATTFVVGDSYADADFSTRTVILDLAAGTVVGEMEKFRTTHNGAVVDAPDVNYWGITFSAADSNRFYATLGFGKNTYLIEGDVRARTARTVHENVECPSLSPDGTRVAYKKADQDGVWHFTVLDLATGAETPVAEPAAIDDQLEWLDDSTLTYGNVVAEVWAVPADGSGAPRRLLSGAQSPSVVR